VTESATRLVAGPGLVLTDSSGRSAGCARCDVLTVTLFESSAGESALDDPKPRRPYSGAVQPCDFVVRRVLVLAAAGLAAGLLIAFGYGRHADRLDAIKSARGTLVVGTGGQRCG
jgi:hypothetical protein